MRELESHGWPSDGEHVWTRWYQNKPNDAKGGPTQYRTCIHPECGASEERKAPLA